MKKSRMALALLVASLAVLGALPARADFDEEPVLVGTDGIGDAPIDPGTAALGVDGLALFIHRPDFTQPEIQFIIQLTELNVPPPPEVVRYFWSVTINNKEYLIQGKMTDVATTAAIDDPAGSATHLQGAFRLRGNCGVLVALNSCPHLKWIDGDFDTALKQVRIRVPLNDPVAPDFVPGAVITLIEAEVGFQAVASLAQTTTDVITGSDDYTIAGP